VPHLRKIVAVLAVAAMMVVPVASAFAADTTETLHIANVLTLTGVPASINYGDITAADHVYQSPAIHITVGSLDNGTFDVTASDFTNGGAALNVSRYFSTEAGQDGNSMPVGDAFPLAGWGPGQGTQDLTAYIGVSVPVLMAGTWTGSLTWSVK
jgi:hypothetical protein